METPFQASLGSTCITSFRLTEEQTKTATFKHTVESVCGGNHLNGSIRPQSIGEKEQFLQIRVQHALHDILPLLALHRLGLLREEAVEASDLSRDSLETPVFVRVIDSSGESIEEAGEIAVVGLVVVEEERKRAEKQLSVLLDEANGKVVFEHGLELAEIAQRVDRFLLGHASDHLVDAQRQVRERD